MAVENITLNLIPTGDTPSIHVAQFDVDRPFNVTLKEGEDDFTPTGYDIELQVRKVDNNIVTAIPTQTSGNVVTFNTTEQMTACSGTNLAELQLTKDSQTFATLHFYLVVQRDVLAGGVTSESDIYNLTEQIAAIVPEVVGEDYYNKEEVDEKIAEIPTFDPTNYYDKSDVDTLLNNKADVSDLPDMTNYYDKSDVDTLLNGKADVSDLPDMTNYYDKSETDTLLSNKADKNVVDKIKLLPTVKSVSGSVVKFDTDIIENVVECVTNIDANANGVSSVDLLHYKENLFSSFVTSSHDGITTSYNSSTGFISIQNNVRTTNYNAGSQRAIVAIGLDTTHNYKYVICPNIVGVVLSTPASEVLSDTFTGVSEVWLRVTNQYDFVNDHPIGDITSFRLFILDMTEGYSTIISVSLGESLTQGGTLTVPTGLLTRTDHTTKQLSAYNIATFNGTNNVFGCCGDTSVKYLETIGKAISD